MTITYKWKIGQLDREVLTGFVTTVHWRVNATDGLHEASTFSSWSSRDGTPEIAYDNLTEEIVLNWIWANAVDKTITEETLKRQIEEQKNPVEASGLPWVTV
mgnify:CR=1 FL=1|tara:strand:+ start:3027 stop:3332 length:306 start_codon:yes stop_codon:yes gene_type:complete